jgi:hypothetical protein
VSKNINVTLHVALNECETWLLTITEEQRLRVFENRVEGDILVYEGGGNRRVKERV